MSRIADLLRPTWGHLLFALAFLSLVGISACVGPQPAPIGAIAAPGTLTLADEKGMLALEVTLNRVAAIATVVAPGLPRAERELRADQLERAWAKLLDLRCIHRAANGLRIPPEDAERCARAVRIHGSDPRALLAEAAGLAHGLAAYFGVE